MVFHIKPTENDSDYVNSEDELALVTAMIEWARFNWSSDIFERVCLAWVSEACYKQVTLVKHSCVLLPSLLARPWRVVSSKVKSLKQKRIFMCVRFAKDQMGSPFFVFQNEHSFREFKHGLEIEVQKWNNFLVTRPLSRTWCIVTVTWKRPFIARKRSPILLKRLLPLPYMTNACQCGRGGTVSMNEWEEIGRSECRQWGQAWPMTSWRVGKMRSENKTHNPRSGNTARTWKTTYVDLVFLTLCWSCHLQLANLFTLPVFLCLLSDNLRSRRQPP